MASGAELSKLLQDGLIATGHVASAAVVRQTDKQLRSATSQFHMGKEGYKTISKAFSHPAATRTNGITIGKHNFVCIRADSESLYLKREGEAVIVCKTVANLLIVMCSGEMQRAICIEAVENLAKYLREKDQ
eukprot:m.39926 g.39926  ORF g.39926 m.39926 type:complete len:132 (-) comp18338_c0_seq1:179-574(-)